MGYLGSIAVSATHTMTIFHTQAFKKFSSSEIKPLAEEELVAHSGRWGLGCQ